MRKFAISQKGGFYHAAGAESIGLDGKINIEKTLGSPSPTRPKILGSRSKFQIPECCDL